jgi:hypothetical protein
MLDSVKPEAVCAYGSVYDHMSVVEASASRESAATGKTVLLPKMTPLDDNLNYIKN